MIENKWQQHAYAAAARDIAPALLGRYLVHKMGKKTLVGRIVETEAYGGVYRRQRDDGSHEPDVSAFLRLCDVHSVPVATNVTSARILLTALVDKPELFNK